MTSNNSGFSITENILKGPEISYPTQDYTSVGEYVLDRLESNNNLIGQVHAVTGEKYTYGTMREKSVKCALWMREQGLIAGDVAVIISHNQMDVPMACFGALYLGVVVKPLDAGLSARELMHLLNIAKPKIVFASKDSIVNVAEAAKRTKFDVQIVVFGTEPGFLGFDDIIGKIHNEKLKDFKCSEIKNPYDTALIIGTSGTTGLPKGVALSQAGILKQMLHLENLGMRGHNCLTYTCIDWITGALCMFKYLNLNIPRLIAPSFEEYLACDIIGNHKVNWILMSSNMIKRLLLSEALNNCDLSSVKRVICTGSPLASSAQEEFAKYLPNAEISLGYGMTELGGFLTLQNSNSKSGSCGQIAGNAQLKVIDPETGRLLGANQKGELLIKTDTMMTSYYDNPQATAEAMDKEGWFHPGDLGYYDEDGEIFVVDRLKELIKYRGHQVSPSEIENVILTYPGVKEVAVIGVPHVRDDEHPMAFVVRASSDSIHQQITEIEVIDFVAAELSDSNRLRAGVRFVDHIPKTSSNKIKRKKLRELAKSMKRFDTNEEKTIPDQQLHP